MRQAVSRTGFDLHKALIWSVSILVLTVSGIGVAYWMGQVRDEPPPPLPPPPAASPQPAPSAPAAPPELVMKEEEPSVAAPYFTKEMNKEIANFRLEDRKAALEKDYQRDLSNGAVREASRKHGESNRYLKDIDKVEIGKEELTRMSVEEKIADPDTARKYAMENRMRYSVRQLLDEPPPPPEPPPDPWPPLPQEPSLIEQIWHDVTSTIRDILRMFL